MTKRVVSADSYAAMLMVALAEAGRPKPMKREKTADREMDLS